MIKLNREETARLNDLKLTVWSHVARKTLKKETSPNEITAETIESHRGRIGKALRLLDGYVSYDRTDSDNSRGYTKTAKIYKIDRMDESKDLGNAPTFLFDIPHIHDEVFGEKENQFDMDTVAFKNIGNLSREEVIYVYWHPDEYLFAENKKEIRIYPKALLDTRMKAIMRAIIEQYFHSNFHSRVEEYLSIPTGSIKKEDHFDISIRNFSAHGHRFTMDKYFGNNGFLEEYTHYRDYFEALIKSLNNLRSHIDAAGGHAVIVEQYRKDIISNLLKKAPLCAFQPYKKKPYGTVTTIEDKFNNPFLNSFILRNSGYMDYELLYMGDKEILFINEVDLCTFNVQYHKEGVGDKTFTPNPNEIDLIKGTK